MTQYAAFDNTACGRHRPDGIYDRYAACGCIEIGTYTATCTSCEDEGLMECPACAGQGVVDEGETDCGMCDAGSVPCPCGQ